MKVKLIQCGGIGNERLYLKNLRFDMPGNQRVVVSKTTTTTNIRDLVARHRGRYYLAAFYCRPGYRVLDFPCGSGYGSAILLKQGVIYEGREYDKPTIEYAKRMYGNKRGMFLFGDLRRPKLKNSYYDIIVFLEGLEHIDKEYHRIIIAAFERALKPGGSLIVSSPENPTGVSGQSTTNLYHRHELTRGDFMDLLFSVFEKDKVEIITQRAVLSTGVATTCFYAICHK